MSLKMLIAFSRAQTMLFGIKQAGSRKPQNHLHIRQFAYSRRREDDSDDNDVLDDEAELDTSALDTLLRSKPALTRR